jgi:hypothetical protein
MQRLIMTNTYKLMSTLLKKFEFTLLVGESWQLKHGGDLLNRKMPELISTSVSGLKYTVVKCRYASPHVSSKILHVLDRTSCVMLVVSLTLVVFYMMSLLSCSPFSPATPSPPSPIVWTSSISFAGGPGWSDSMASVADSVCWNAVTG